MHSTGSETSINVVGRVETLKLAIWSLALLSFYWRLSQCGFSTHISKFLKEFLVILNYCKIYSIFLVLVQCFDCGLSCQCFSSSTQIWNFYIVLSMLCISELCSSQILCSFTAFPKRSIFTVPPLLFCTTNKHFLLLELFFLFDSFIAIVIMRACRVWHGSSCRTLVDGLLTSFRTIMKCS